MPEQPFLTSGWGVAETDTALTAFLRSLPARPRLLGLGEPTHGVQEFPRWRNRFLRTLVQQHGFRSVALESDVLAGLRVNDFVLGGPGALDEVISSGFSHGFGAYEANRELVAWLRKFNMGREETGQVRFYGFDAPMENMWAASPRLNLLALHRFVTGHVPAVPVDAATIERLCGDDTRWTNEAAAMNPTQSVGGTGEARELRLIADDLHHLLKGEAPRLHALPGFHLAQLHARTALGLLRYHAVMAESAPERVAQMLAQRDLMMADNLSAMAEQEEKRGPTLVFAHNLHLQRGVSGLNLGPQRAEWWSAGAHISA